jgi:death-on-curing family protein
MKILTISDIEFIAFRLAKETMDFNEPIPDFSTRYPGKLESCLMAPFQTFYKKPLYKGLNGKAAMLFYLMIKNHPFQNGNKRIAMTTLLTFLFLNKKWLKVDSRELYNFAMWVAQSPAPVKEEAILSIEKFIGKYLANLW